MAKTSMKNRDIRRKKLNKKYGTLRAKQREIISSLTATDEEKILAEKVLQTMPRDASRCRQRNRCALCGRSRAYNRLTGLCRIHMRAAVMNGMVPGMHKASW